MARALLGPLARVSACLRYQAFGHEGVKCIHIPARRAARLGGLQTCGSVWLCPICSAKITERRRVELRRAVDVHRAKGGLVVMVTYTFSHQLGQHLAALVGSSGSGSLRAGNLVPASGLMGARSLSMSGAPYQRVKELGINGSVRCVELTHGKNGWHPHIHELLFLAPGVDVSEESPLAVKLAALWHKGVVAVGLTASAERGFDWTVAGAEIEEYIAKWGHEPTEPVWDCSAEITKQPAKMGRGAGDVKGKTPFQLLADCRTLEGVDADSAGSLFMEYADVMHGRRQLVWSRWDTGEKTEKGKPKTVSFLTHLLGVAERSDEEVAAASEDAGVLLYDLPYRAWRMLVVDGRRADLWNLLRNGDADAVGLCVAPYVERAASSSVSTAPGHLDELLTELEQFSEVAAFPASTGPGAPALRGSAPELTERDADIAEFMFQFPTASEVQAAAFVDRAARRERVAANLAVASGAARAVVKSEPRGIGAGGRSPSSPARGASL